MAVFVMNRQTGKYEQQRAPVQPVRQSSMAGLQFQGQKAPVTKPQANQMQYANNVPEFLKSFDQGMRSFSKGAENLPKFHFADNVQNPVGRFLASIAQNMANIPSKAASTVLGGYGEDPFSKETLKRASRAVETGLDIGSLIGGGGAVKNLASRGIQQGIKPAIVQGIKSGATQGASYGAGYGATGAIQNDKAIITELLKNAAIGGLGGAVIGASTPLLGAGLNKIIPSKKVGDILSEVEKTSKTNETPVQKLSQVKTKNVDTVPVVPNTGTKKQRGWAKTISESDLTSPEVRKKLQDSTYTPQKNDELVNHATTLIKSDLNKANEIALTRNDNLGVATASELIKHYQNQGDYNAAANIAKEVATKLTEAGRTVQAASLYNKLTPEGLTTYAQKELSKEGLTLSGEQAKILHELATEANNLSGEAKVIATTKMLQKVHEFIPSKFADQMTTVWKAGLLTNPTTHIANVLGNTTMTALETAKDYPAVLLDKFASVFTGNRTKALPNGRAMASGVVSGGKKAWTFLKTGVDVDNTLGKIDYKQVNLPIGLKQYTNSIFRALGATDKVFKETLFKKTLHELAVVDGINKGLKGKELANHVVEAYSKPSNQMVEQATNDALYGTFNSENALSNALNQLKRSDKAGVRVATELIAPFGKTPANVAARIADYSPYGLVKGISQGIKGDQRGSVESISRGLIGSGIIGAGYGLGKAGMMTGNYPTNPTERALWETTGKQPGAIKLGDNWYSTNRISPVGNLLSIGSGMADLGRIKPENVPGAMAAVAGKNLLGQTYLQGVSGALDALQDPNRSAATWAENTAKGVIPSFIGAVARYADPYKRQVNSVGDALQSRIPGLSSNLLPKVDVFGNKLMQESNPFINPFNTTKAKDTPLSNEIDRLYSGYAGASLSHPDQAINIGQGIKIDLTPSEYTAYEQKTGGAFNGLLNALIKSNEYKKLSDYDKSQAINKTISTIRQMWGIQNAGQLENKNDVINQIQQKIQLRQPNSFYTK